MLRFCVQKRYGFMWVPEVSRKVHGRFHGSMLRFMLRGMLQGMLRGCCEPVPHYSNDHRTRHLGPRTWSSGRGTRSRLAMPRQQPKAGQRQPMVRARVQACRLGTRGPGIPEPGPGMKIPKSKMNLGVHGRFTEGSRKVHGRAPWIYVQRPGQGPCQTYS